MPVTRRNPPLFGPAQAAGYNVPRGISFDELRRITDQARRRNEPILSVKNQIRAIIAAAGLTSAAAGALTMRAYQYVDQKFGKRPRDTDASEAGTEHSRLRGAKQARTIDADLPSYEDVSSREDDFVEQESKRIGDSVQAAFAMQDDEENAAELERQEKEDESIRNVLLKMRGDGDFDLDVRGQHPESFDNLPSSDQVSTQDIEPHPFDQELMSETHDIPMEDSDAPAVAAMARSSGATASPSSSSMQVTPVARIPPSYPFHQTTEAVLEHYGGASYMIMSGGDSGVLKIRMNTYHQPYAETSGSVADATNYGENAASTWYRQLMGRYVMNKGSTGDIMEKLYNRKLRNIPTPLFATGTLSDMTPSGSWYYNYHYNAYTVTKCEWMLRVEFPFHAIKGTYTTNDAPATSDVLASVTSVNDWTTTPPSTTGARVFTHYEMTGDTITAVSPPLTASTQNMERWQNAYDNKVTVPVHGSKTIRGTWYPGKVKHNPLNDDDVQVWASTGGVPGGGHLEHLVIQLKEIANANGKNDATGTTYMVNFNLDVKWYVQFKERKTEIQYPITNQTNLSGTAVNALVLENYGVGTSQYPT